MAPTLYHVPKTISSPIVQILIEIGAINDVKVEKKTFPSIKEPDYLAINPMGTSPTLTDADRDIVMYESGAILSYLLEEYDVKHEFHPPVGSTPEERTRRASYLFLQTYILATVYPFVASLFIHTLQPEENQDAAYLEVAKSKWRTLLGPTLTIWMDKTEGDYFLGGNSLSAIDLLICKPLNNANSMGELEQFPRLKQLFDKVRVLPSFGKAYDIIDRKAAMQDAAAWPSGRSFVLVPAKSGAK